MNVRIVSLLLLLCTSCGSQVPSADHGDTLSQARESGHVELRVLWVGSAGWAGYDEHGHLTGVTIEIMRRFADWVEQDHDMDVELDFIEVDDWSRFYARVRDGSGGLFGLGNVTITEERRQELAFSPPYVTNVAVLISHRDIEPLKDQARIGEVFAGLRAMGFEGTLHEQRLRDLAEAHWPDMPIDLAGSNDAILNAAAAGTHFAYIDAYNFYRAQAEGAPVQRHAALDDPGEQFGIIMPLDNDWQPLLTEFFASNDGLLESDWYGELLSRHLGEGVADMLR